MNKGSKFIHQIMAAYEKDQLRKAESPLSVEYYSSSEPNLTAEHKTSEEQKKLIIKQKERNFIKRLYQLSPTLKNNHIFKLYGFMGINQSALQNPDFNESLVYSFLESRVIERVQFYEHALVIQVTEARIPSYQPSVEYIIQKYMSKGETKFHELALLIQEVCSLFKLSQQMVQPEDRSESVKKWLDLLGDQMYVCSIGTRRFAISKALLGYLQYDLNEFAIQAIKYRVNFIQFFSAINYGTLVKHLLNCLKYIAKCSLGLISLSEFKQLTTYHFSDFVESKNHVRSFCDMTITMLSPSQCCHKINFIYYKETERKGKVIANTETCLAIQNEKERIRQAEYATIKKIKPVPRSLLKSNRKILASYKCTQTKNHQEKEQQSQ